MIRRLSVAIAAGALVQRGPGRPLESQDIRGLAVRLAIENTSRGCTRIRDVLALLGYAIGRTTIRRILAEHGIGLAPERR